MAESDGLVSDSPNGALAVDGRALRERGGAGRLFAVLLGGREGTASPPKLPFTREGITDGDSLEDGRLSGLTEWLAADDPPTAPRPRNDTGGLDTDSGRGAGAGSNEGRKEMRLEDATVADLARFSEWSSF